MELNRSSFHAQSESVFLPPVDKFLFILLQCFLFRSFRIVLFSFSSSRNNQIVPIYPKIERSLDKKDFSPSIRGGGGGGESSEFIFRVQARSIFGICRKMGREGYPRYAGCDIIPRASRRAADRIFCRPAESLPFFSRANKGRLHAKLVQDWLFVFH